MADKSKRKRDNIYFRQTPSAFKVNQQTEVYSHINRNIPYKIYQFSKQQFLINLEKLKNQYTKIITKIPKGSKKVA